MIAFIIYIVNIYYYKYEFVNSNFNIKLNLFRVKFNYYSQAEDPQILDERAACGS